MRGVIIHLVSASEKEVEDWLTLHFGKQNEDGEWRFPDQNNSELYINFYKNYQIEFEQEEYINLLRQIGSRPSTSVAVDVSGKINGHKVIIAFVVKILKSFDGFVSDDYSDHLWSLQEIEEDLTSNSQKFFAFDTQTFFP